MRIIEQYAARDGQAIKGVGMWPLACWDCDFESRRWLEYPCLLSVVCWQDGSFVRRSPIERGLSECDLETSTMRRPRSARAVEALKK